MAQGEIIFIYLSSISYIVLLLLSLPCMPQDSGHFTCGCLMSNSRYLLTGVSDGCLMLWDIKNKNPTKTFEVKKLYHSLFQLCFFLNVQAHTSPVTGIVSSYNDQLVLSGGQEGKLLLHSLTPSHTLQNTVVLTHSDTVSQVYTHTHTHTQIELTMTA